MNLNILESVGAASLLLVGAFILWIIFLIVKDTVHKSLIARKIKKRFNKPPTAKCYCRDCEQWEPETAKCWDNCNSRLMAPDWFCCFAEPLTGDRFKEREKVITKMEQELREKRKKRGFSKNGKH